MVMPDLDFLLGTGARETQHNRFRWATVVSGSPLLVRFDGESTELASEPDSLIGQPLVGSRVLCLLWDRRVVVLGQGGNYDTGWTDLVLKSGYQPSSGNAAFTPMIRRIGKVVYLTGIVAPTSGTFASGSGHHYVADIPYGFAPGKPNYSSLYFAAGGQTVYSACRIRIVGTRVEVASGATDQDYISLDGATWTVD